jgi:hypothetical protein
MDTPQEQACLPVRPRDVAAVIAAVLACGVIYLSGRLLEPDMPAGPYYVEWSGVSHGEAAAGPRVIVAAAGNVATPPGPLARSVAATEFIRRGGLLLLAVEVPQPPASPVTLLAFHAPDGSHAVTIALHGGDVLFSQRLRAQRHGLLSPPLRVRDALASATPGDTIRIATAAQGRTERCMQVEEVPYCGLARAPGDGWRLLTGHQFGTERADSAAGAAWLALLLLPAGLLARPRLAALLLVAVVWYLSVRLPVDTILLRATPVDLGAAAAGLLIGTLLSRRAASRKVTPAPEPVIAQ